MFYLLHQMHHILQTTENCAPVLITFLSDFLIFEPFYCLTVAESVLEFHTALLFERT